MDATANVQGFTLSNCSRNRALRGGVAYLMGGGTLFINSSHFEQNFADGPGGCFYIDASARFTSEYNTHHGSESKGDGAVVYGALKSSIYIRDSAYEHGESHTDGGAVFVDYAETIIMERTLFLHNVARNGGGAR